MFEKNQTESKKSKELNTRGGSRKGAGRKAGSLTKRTQEIVAKSVAEGISPLEYMLQVLRDEAADRDERMEAAKSAAPYIHPRLAAIEHTGAGGKDLIAGPILIGGPADTPPDGDPAH